MSLEKVRDISVIVSVIGIFISIIFVTFTYIASIKNNTESIPSISTAVAHVEERTKDIQSVSTAITRVQEHTQDISLIKEIVIALRAETKAYITPQKGGELVSRDWRITVTVHPGSIPEPASLNYTPVVDLPGKLPEGIQPAGYNFALAPYTLAGLQLSKSLQTPAEAFIPYKNLNLDPTIKPTDILLQRWDAEQGKWIPIKTDIKGEVLHAYIPELGLFTLSIPTPEVSREP